jgi:hypothetical protein
MTMAVVHLYWQHTQPRWFERIRRGYSLCGKQYGREELTRWVDDTTCDRCLAKLQENAPAATGAQSTIIAETTTQNRKEGRDDPD